jgi:hypothetical protein
MKHPPPAPGHKRRFSDVPPEAEMYQQQVLTTGFVYLIDCRLKAGVEEKSKSQRKQLTAPGKRVLAIINFVPWTRF